jgi:translocation and assembly module TamA
VRWIAVLAVALSACRPAPPRVAVTNPVSIGDVRLEGFDVLPVEVRENLTRQLPLRAGSALTDEAEEAAGNRAVEVFQNHGYPYAQVGIRREPLDQSRVRVVLAAEPGTLGFFGPIDIAGNRRVDDAIIRRRLAYKPGDPFSRSAIERTQQRLGAIGLFKSVEIRAVNIDLKPAGVPTLITVEEGTPWQWNLGFSYAAGERLGIDARLSHLDFLGSARRLDLQGRISRVEGMADVGFTQADAWHPSLAFTLQARHREIDERSFFVLSRGGQAAVSWQWTPSFSTTGAYAVALEESDVDPTLAPLLVLQDGMLSAWSLDLAHRTPPAADTPPVRTLSLHVEQAGGWMSGTFDYFSVVGDVRHYARRRNNRVVLASRIRYGTIDPAAGDDDIPLLKRFFLGGLNEMRGWGIYEVSPLSATGEPVGGRSMFTATGEVRFPIFKRLSGAIFVEAGHVWEDSWTMRPHDLLYDAGPGLRIDTNFGLLRLDFGYQLKTLEGLRIDGRPQEYKWRFNFGIGEVF